MGLMHGFAEVGGAAAIGLLQHSIQFGLLTIRNELDTG